MLRKKFITTAIPWAITFFAIYYALKGVNWKIFISHLSGTSPLWLGVAVFLTVLSYFIRSWRWLYFFSQAPFSYAQSYCALIIGFFMNNILPARTGELVRAHVGAKLGNSSRTLMLATIASERLADGLTLSIFFVLFAVGKAEGELAKNLLYVAFFFAAATVAAIVTIGLRAKVMIVAEKIHNRINHPISGYTVERLETFLKGLTPLTSLSHLPAIIFGSLLVWLIEAGVYVSVIQAYGKVMPLSYSILFMVAVNFSSLIPSAPGAIGVIEAVATTVLMSLGIEKELALAMVITQHAIQYFVVGLQGIVLMFAWKLGLNVEEEIELSSDKTGVK
ncbi:MAG: UPF0104 family protein [Candidatus Dadabacteria bacterium]|nr:MAG: UPF0104 family protein [Candidatus Dadabacteria bacterium]